MPFTFAHPAIVVPLHQLIKKSSLSALVIGSLIPDFEYFLRLRMESKYSHTVLGIIWFDLPLGFLVYMIYQSIIKTQLLHRLPYYFRIRLSESSNIKNDTRIIIISLLIGILTHIVWDSLTHYNGYVVTHSFLRENMNIASISIPLYKFLQHLSTLVGISFLINYIHNLPKKHTEIVYKNDLYWHCVLSSIIIAVLYRIMIQQNNIISGHFIAFIIGVTLWSILITSLIFTQKRF